MSGLNRVIFAFPTNDGLFAIFVAMADRLSSAPCRPISNGSSWR